MGGLADPELMFAAHRAAYLEYHQQVIAVAIDMIRKRSIAPLTTSLEIVGPRTNCVMGTGALPLETPPENIRLIREYLAT